jgi:hypothetical protein
MDGGEVGDVLEALPILRPTRTDREGVRTIEHWRHTIRVTSPVLFIISGKPDFIELKTSAQ